MSPSIEAFSPIGRHPEAEQDVRTSIPDLRGSVIGVLDNTKPNAQLLMGEVAQAVVERVPEMRLEFERKPSAAQGVEEDVRERLAATANVIFTGSGD